MSREITILEVTYHTDTETGIYSIGEIDFGIKCGVLSNYLQIYGLEGKREIIRTLAYLIYAVESEWIKKQEKKMASMSGGN